MAELGQLGMLPHGMRRRKSQSTAQIYIDELMEEFTCPICFDEIDKCMMTKCGHNFCSKCIDECLNRKHICPFCSTECTQDELVKNVHLDSVLSKLVKARANASKELIQSLMHKTVEESKKNAAKITSESPITQIFTKYTSETLVKYENYYQEMLRENNKTQLRLQDKLMNKLAILIPSIKIMQNNFKKQPGQNDNDNDNDNDIKMNDNKIEELFTNILYVEENDNKYIINLKTSITMFISYIKMNCQQLNINEIELCLSVFYAEIELAQKRVNKSCKLLFESYEEYMKKTSPSPFLLPVSVTIRLRGRPQFWDLKLNSTDHIGVVLNIIKKKFEDLGDPIDKFIGNNNNNNNNTIELGVLRPLQERDPEKPLEIITELNMCLTELNIRHGTQIHVLTAFTLKSEAPRPCFTYNYNKDKGDTCDYYRCKTCGFNWVCKACSLQCHKSHNLVPFMMGHKPSYACCYCVKKKKCKILNIKSKKN